MNFYHATSKALDKDALIEPGHPPHAATGDPDGLVFFADNWETAEEWGSMLTPDGETVYTYEVEPAGPIEPDRGVATRQVREGNYQSRSPLRIKKLYLTSEGIGG